MEKGDQDVGGHSHPPPDKPPSQLHGADTEIQEIPPVAILPSGRRIKGHALETIQPYALAPWVSRVPTVTDEPEGVASTAPYWTARIAVSSSARNGLVGYGGAVEIRTSTRASPMCETRAVTLGAREEQNPFTGELAAIADMLHSLPKLRYRNILLFTRNRAAVFTLKKPRQQSGQRHVCQAYKAIQELRREGNSITIAWLPTGEENQLMDRAKREAKSTTQLRTLRATVLHSQCSHHVPKASLSSD